jgi:hypothetical protein
MLFISGGGGGGHVLVLGGPGLGLRRGRTNAQTMLHKSDCTLLVVMENTMLTLIVCCRPCGTPPRASFRAWTATALATSTATTGVSSRFIFSPCFGVACNVKMICQSRYHWQIKISRLSKQIYLAR